MLDMESLKIVVLCVLAAAAYGVIHELVTARICIEYFTILHPAIFPTTSPTLLALGWGILATWWVGAILGVLLALAARAGSRPRSMQQTWFARLGSCYWSWAYAQRFSGFWVSFCHDEESFLHPNW